MWDCRCCKIRHVVTILKAGESGIKNLIWLQVQFEVLRSAICKLLDICSRAAMEWRNLNFGEKLLHFLLPLSALLAFGALYLTSSCRSMLGIYGLGVVITMFIAVPDWPYFNRNPLSWHQPLGIDGLTERASSFDAALSVTWVFPHLTFYLRSESIKILPGSSAGVWIIRRWKYTCIYICRCELHNFVSMIPEAHEDLVSAWTLMMLLASNHQLMMHWCRHYSWEPERESRMFLFPVLIVAFMVSRAA